jgi:hypothetical protein
MIHIHKPSILHPPLKLTPRIRILAELTASITAHGIPLLHCVLRLHGSILGIHLQVIFLELSVSARLCRCETLADQLFPV